jgi:hypothetical protein
MTKLRALVLLAALAVLQKAPPCLATEPDAKPSVAQQPTMPDTHPTQQRTMPMRDAASPSQLPVQPPPAISKGDGGKRDETIGGLPGAKPEIGEKQP